MSCILALGLWITFKNAKSKALQVHYYIYSKDIIRQWTVHQLIPWSSFKTWEANFLQIKGQENLFSSLEKLVFPPTPILPPTHLRTTIQLSVSLQGVMAFWAEQFLACGMFPPPPHQQPFSIPGFQTLMPVGHSVTVTTQTAHTHFQMHLVEKTLNKLFTSFETQSNLSLKKYLGKNIMSCISTF